AVRYGGAESETEGWRLQAQGRSFFEFVELARHATACAAAIQSLLNARSYREMDCLWVPAAVGEYRLHRGIRLAHRLLHGQCAVAPGTGCGAHRGGRDRHRQGS